MDSVTLVAPRIEEGQLLLDLLDDAGIVIDSAAWLKPFEKERWILYMVTPILEEKGENHANGAVLRIYRKMWTERMNDLHFRLIGEKEPLAIALADLRRQYPGGGFMNGQITYIGRITIDEMYLYPAGKQASTKVTIYGMVFKGQPNAPIHLALEPHNPHSRLTIEQNGICQEYPARIGIDWVVAAPVGAVLEEDEIHQTVLAWEIHGQRKQSTANEVWSLAKMGLHGFRFLKQPDLSAIHTE